MFLRVPGVRLTSEQRQQLRQSGRFFPNQIADGSFEPHSTIVEVSAFRSEEVVQAMAAGNLLPVRKDIQVLCHEMSHWFDFFGTIWGRNYIHAICRAHLAMYQGELGFPAVIDLFDRDRQVMTPAYYRYTTSPEGLHDVNRPWAIQYTSGCEIDPDGRTNEGKPIFLVNFGENPSRKNFARQPLSVGALLEVRAVAAEIDAGFAAVGSCPDEALARTEASIMMREFNGLVYDHNLVEYTVAAHFLSVEAGTKEFVLTYRLAAALAHVALNLQAADFERLKVPEAHAPFGERIRAFKGNMDRGYAFVCLIQNGGRYVEGQDYVETCVRKSGLGSVSEILDRATATLREPVFYPHGTLLTRHFTRECMLTGEVGEEFRKRPFFLLNVDMLLSCLDILPPFLPGDGEFVASRIERAQEYNPEVMYAAALELRGFTRNLLIGCRGFDEDARAL